MARITSFKPGQRPPHVTIPTATVAGSKNSVSLGPAVSIVDLVWDPSAPDTVFASVTGGASAPAGVYVSRDEGRTFSAPMALGHPGRNPTRPYVLAGAKGTVIAWKEFDGEKTSVHIATSRDDGETWSSPKAISSTTDTSDHPLLVSNGGQIYLSWMTKADGYRLIAIEDQP